MNTYHCNRSKSGARIYFRARWVKRRKNYQLWLIHPHCEDVIWKPKGSGFWNFDPSELVGRSRKLKGRPTNQTLTKAWTL